MSKYVRLCPNNRTDFLTFRREDFFAVIPGSVAVAGIFLSSLVNPEFFSYLYISITGIFFLRALKSGLIPPSEWYGHRLIFTIPFFLLEECPHGHSKVSVQLLNGFRVTHVPTKRPCNADILQSRISRVITCGTPFPADADHHKSINIMTEISKNGRPPSPNRCTHCVMVRFDDLDDDGRIHKRRKKKS